jgi:hypothetical protein
MNAVRNKNSFLLKLSTLLVMLGFTSNGWCRDVEYKNEEISIYVTPGEPTQVQFPGVISGGFKKKQSSVSLDRKKTDLVVFAQDNIPENGEAIIVRLEDGRSYPMRVKRADTTSPRDDVIHIEDGRPSITDGNNEEEPAYREKNFDYAPPSQVSGFMREMMLNAEFGKASITGYRASDRHKGETVLNDGTMKATIDKIYVGPDLWGYVIDTENLLDQTQKINPATFRLDGTRAVSVSRWEVSPRPTNPEEEAAEKHKAKVYIITKAR